MLIVKKAFIDYKVLCKFTNDDLKEILNTTYREYLPGYGRLRFMILLKSLIDPSYFRVEEQLFRGMAFKYANEISVVVKGNTITITDNGRGIPQDEVIDTNTNKKILPTNNEFNYKFASSSHSCLRIMR